MENGQFPAAVIVLHVKNGYDDRARHIEAMLGSRNIPFIYILDGDIPDLTNNKLVKYFTEGMRKPVASTSCTLKHIYAYEYIVSHGLDGALILEDDMILYKNFESIFQKCMQERKNRMLDSCLISFEDSNLQFVKGSARIKGQHLYVAERDRFAGCYYISAECACQILDYIRINKCDAPVDVFHSELISRINLPYYWSYPTIATQGSHCGLFASSISKKSARKRLYRKLTWVMKRIYKTILYRLR